jgi:hypothetical protein
MALKNKKILKYGDISTDGDISRDDLKKIAKSILKEARKRAKYEMDCLTDLVLQEAKVISRYARKRPFYIS